MIYIDASRYNNTDRRTGVENYSYYLINELVSLHPNEITLIAPRLIDLKVPKIVIPFPRLWTQIRLSWYLFWNRSVKTLLVPSHVIPFISAPTTVTTVHDVAFKRFPESYSFLSRLYLNWGVKRAVQKAKAIIVPSVATQNDLIEFYGADPQQIYVIPLGFTSTFRDEGAQLRQGSVARLPINDDLKYQHYFLFIGRLETKKNIMVLIEAFKEFSTAHPEIKLVLAGKFGHGSELIRPHLDHPAIVYLDYVSDEVKQSLLRHALAFVFPSLYEGFGIPLLEAMDANLPVIASDIPSTREIMDDRALYFNPSSSHELAQAMQVLSESAQKRSELIQGYSKRLQRYTWEGTADSTWKVLQALTQSNP